MRALAIGLVLGGVVSVASAQPVTRPERCDVTYVYAPEVASWIADAWTVSPPIAPAPRSTPTIVVPASMALVDSAPVAATASGNAPRRWRSLYGMIDSTEREGLGFRAELDVFLLGPFKLGAFVSYDETMLPGGEAPHFTNFDDTKFGAYLAYSYRRAGWEVRAAGGLALMHTNGVTYDSDSTLPLGGALVGVADGSFTISRDLGQRWAIAAGTVATRGRQEWSLGGEMIGTSLTPIVGTLTRNETMISRFAGVRRRL